MTFLFISLHVFISWGRYERTCNWKWSDGV